MRFRHYSLIFILAFIGGAIGDLLGHHLLLAQGLPNFLRPKYLSAGKGFVITDTHGQTWVELTKYSLIFLNKTDDAYIRLSPRGLHLGSRETASSVALSPSTPCLLCLQQLPQGGAGVGAFLLNMSPCGRYWQFSPAAVPKLACGEDARGLAWEIP